MARYEGWHEADVWARLWKGRPPHSTRRPGWWSKTPFSELKTVLARQAQTRAVGAAGDMGSGEEPLGGEARRLTASRRPGLWLRELGWAPGLPGSRGGELPGEEPPSDDRQAPQTGGRRQHALGSHCPRAQAGLGGRGLPAVLGLWRHHSSLRGGPVSVCRSPPRKDTGPWIQGPP